MGPAMLSALFGHTSRRHPEKEAASKLFEQLRKVQEGVLILSSRKPVLTDA